MRLLNFRTASPPSYIGDRKLSQEITVEQFLSVPPAIRTDSRFQSLEPTPTTAHDVNLPMHVFKSFLYISPGAGQIMNILHLIRC